MSTLTAADFRSALLTLREHANGELDHIWLPTADYIASALNGDAKAKAAVTSALSELLPGLVGDYQQMAATLAADWYDEARADLNVPGNFTATMLIPDQGVPSLIGYSLSKATTVEGFQQFIAGGVQLRVAQAANGTIMASNLADPQGAGWEREAGPDACPFCRMLASRGAVYKTEATATFAPHDDCHCVAVSAWKGTRVAVSSTYTPSDRDLSPEARAKVNAQARAWMQKNGLLT